MRGLKDRVAIITGAGRGLGHAAATRLAEEGCHLLINDVDESTCRDTAAKLSKLGVKTAASVHDVSNHSDAKEMVATAERELGHVNILVNNAGILRDGMLHKMSEEQFDAVIRVNLKGVFNCTQAFALAVKQREGRCAIVNISSIAYLGNIGQTNYAAAKAGVAGMTRSWAMEMARYNVRVNAVAPGLMETEMTTSIPEQLKQDMIARIPARRMGRPEEFASLVAFLASEEASYMTGQVLHLDGGSSVGGL